MYRLFVMENMLAEDDPKLIEPVLRAAERGNVALFTPMDAELYSSKGALALLSDEANRHLFSPDELAVLDRFIRDPDGPARPGHRRRPVGAAGGLRDARARGTDPQADAAARRGRRHPRLAGRAAQWQRLLEDAYDQPFVLQQRIHPYTEPFPKEDGSGFEDWVVLWGTFLGARGGYAGSFMRGTPKADAGVLNIATGAIGGCCFHELG